MCDLAGVKYAAKDFGWHHRSGWPVCGAPLVWALGFWPTTGLSGWAEQTDTQPLCSLRSSHPTRSAFLSCAILSFPACLPRCHTGCASASVSHRLCVLLPGKRLVFLRDPPAKSCLSTRTGCSLWILSSSHLVCLLMGLSG